jgi:hypothetical protein
MCSASSPRPSGNALRFRIWPEGQVGLSLVGKKPGAGWTPQQEELILTEHPGSDIRPYDRLIAAALSGDRWLFARQDTVEASCRATCRGTTRPDSRLVRPGGSGAAIPAAIVIATHPDRGRTSRPAAAHPAPTARYLYQAAGAADK